MVNFYEGIIKQSAITVVLILLLVTCNGKRKLESEVSTELHHYEQADICIPELKSKVYQSSCICYGKGLCQNVNDTRTCSCCFHALYEKPSEKCNRIDYCKSSPCQNGGTCQQVLGNHFCACMDGFHGQNCQKENGQGKRVSKPEIYIQTVNTYGEITAMFLTFDNNTGDKFFFSLTSGRVKIIGDKSLLEDGSLNDTFAKKWSWITVSPDSKKIFYMPLMFSRKKDEDKYKVDIFVQVNNSEEIQFSSQYNVHVVPGMEKDCTLIIELDGCGEGNTDMPNLKRGKDYSIRSKSTNPCDPDELMQVNWLRCNITAAVPFPLFEFQTKNLFSNTKKKANCEPIEISETELNVKAYTLNYGIYAMVLMALTENSNRHAAQTCWFRVVADPVIAELDGGSARDVSGKVELILDASKSRDPNERDGVKSHLVFKWSCKPEKQIACSIVSQQNASIIKLQPDIGEYTFTVQVSVDKEKAPTIGTYPEETLPDPGIATQVITVVEEKITQLAIECIRNCDIQTTSGEVLYLKATCSKHCEGADKNGFYKWLVGENGVEESDTELGLNVDKLIIKENVLSPGRNYTITVTGGSNGRAEQIITTRRSLMSELGQHSCSIQPTEGISGIDYFSCMCDYPEESFGFPLRFELFQIPDPRNSAIEIMITYSTKREMKDLLLAAGTLVNKFETKIYVRIQDHFGEFIKRDVATITVKPITEIKNFTNTTEAVKKLIVGENGRPSLHGYVNSGDMSGAVSLVSLLAVALDSTDLDEREVWQLKKQFIDAIGKIPVYHDTPLRQVTAVLHLLFDTDKNKQLQIPHETVVATADILVKITQQLCLEINDSYIEFELSTVELINVSKMVIKMTHTLLSGITNTMTNLTSSFTSTTPADVTEDFLAGPDYPAYFELNPEYADGVKMFKVVSSKIVTSVENVGKAILHSLAAEENARVIDLGFITIWMKVDRPTNMKNILLGAGNTSQGLKISEELARTLESDSEYIGVYVLIIKENPFVWDPENDLNTGVVLINIYNQAINRTLELTSPIYLYLSTPDDTSFQAIEGNVTVPLKSIHDMNILEDCISVHRIEAKEGQTPYLKFEPFEDPTYKLQIVITVGVRPLLEHFKKYSESVPRTVPTGDTQDNLTVFVDGVSTQERSWFYLGILPHPDTLQRASSNFNKNSNFTLRYSFHVKIIKCHFWNITSMEWSIEGCKPGPETTPGILNCVCSHLSMFSGSLLSPLNALEPFHNIPMLLFGADNFKIVIFVASILVLYFILLAWARWKDRRDNSKRIVTVLEDNYPGSSYTYLIGVYTGWKWNAGTTANVGIQLIGEKWRSTTHILKDNTRTVHARNSDNWFVIFTTRDLGNLQQLRLWHDNTGHSPPWYCNKVVVRDVQQNTVWIFVVQRWLSLLHKRRSVYCSVPLQQQQESLKENVKLGFEEQHIWTSIFMRHSWSTYTTCQRLTMLLYIVLTTMLLSLFLCGTPQGNIADQIDEASFHFPSREIALTLMAALVLTPFHFLQVLLFRKTASNEVVSNPLVGAILTASPTTRQKTLWWQSFVNFFMLEPLLHLPRITTGDLKDVPQKGRSSLKRQKFKQEFKGSSYWFPSWFIYITWMLCSLLIVVCVTLLILLGLMFAEVKSEMWVVAVLLYILLSILVLQPLKVIIFSLVLSYLIRKTPYNLKEVDVFFLRKDKHYEEIDRKRAIEIKKLWMKQMYRPLKAQDILKLEKRDRIRAKLSDLFIDLCMFLVYIITLYWLVLGTRDELAYFSTNSLRKSIVFSNDFKNVRSGKEIINYVNEIFLPSIHTEQWYNEDKIKAAGVTSLYDTRLLGLIRMRQLRVTNRTCDITSEVSHLVGRCNVEFSVNNEDTQDYNIGWEPYESVSHRNTRATVPWLYTSMWEAGTPPVTGRFAVYPGGGYITTLGRTLDNSLLIFNFLTGNKWLDHYTRALFIEFTLYNANRNIFNVITLLVEISAYGAIHATEDIKTVKLLMKFEEFGPSILAALVLWMMALLIFTMRQMAKLGHVSLRVYFDSWWNITDLIILALALGTIGMYFLRSEYVSHLIKELEEADSNEYVNFIWAGYWQIQLRYFMAALVCLSSARLWKLLRFQHQFRHFERILVRAFKTLFFLTFMMLIIIMGFALFSYIFLGHSNYLFSNFLFAFVAMFTYGIGFGNVHDRDFFKQDTLIGPVFIVMFWFAYIIYLVNIFVTVINISYEESQKEESLFQEDYTMLDYIRDEIHYICKWRKHISDTDDTKERQISIREKYPHYFKEETLEPGFKIYNLNESIPPQDESLTNRQVFYVVEDKKNNWPVTKFKPLILDTKYARLRAGEDVNRQPIYAPAIAIPKPDGVRYNKAEQMASTRLNAMKHLLLATLQRQTDKRQHAMVAVTLDCIQQSNPENDKSELLYFYKGLDGTEKKFISDTKLREMEGVVNKAGTERYLTQMDVAQSEVEDRDETEVEKDFTSHADILAIQMVRLYYIICNWTPEDSEIQDKKAVGKLKYFIDMVDETEDQKTIQKRKKKHLQESNLVSVSITDTFGPIPSTSRAVVNGTLPMVSTKPDSIKNNIYERDFCGLYPLKYEFPKPPIHNNTVFEEDGHTSEGGAVRKSTSKEPAASTFLLKTTVQHPFIPPRCVNASNNTVPRGDFCGLLSHKSKSEYPTTQNVLLRTNDINHKQSNSLGAAVKPFQKDTASVSSNVPTFQHPFRDKRKSLRVHHQATQTELPYTHVDRENRAIQATAEVSGRTNVLQTNSGECDSYEKSYIRSISQEEATSMQMPLNLGQRIISQHVEEPSRNNLFYLANIHQMNTIQQFPNFSIVPAPQRPDRQQESSVNQSGSIPEMRRIQEFSGNLTFPHSLDSTFTETSPTNISPDREGRVRESYSYRSSFTDSQPRESPDHERYSTLSSSNRIRFLGSFPSAAHRSQCRYFPPDLCSHCGFSMLSDDEKLLFTQETFPYSYRNPEQEFQQMRENYRVVPEPNLEHSSNQRQQSPEPMRWFIAAPQRAPGRLSHSPVTHFISTARQGHEMLHDTRYLRKRESEQYIRNLQSTRNVRNEEMQGERILINIPQANLNNSGGNMPISTNQSMVRSVRRLDDLRTNNAENIQRQRIEHEERNCENFGQTKEHAEQF